MTKIFKLIYVSAILTCFAGVANCAGAAPAVIVSSAPSTAPSAPVVSISTGAMAPAAQSVQISTSAVTPLNTTVALSTGIFTAANEQSAPAESGSKIVPYYSLDILDAVSIPSEGDTIFPLNLTNDLGIMGNLSDRNNITGFYELKYTGPGIKKEEGEQFTDRTMDHVLVFRDEQKLNEKYSLKTQLDFMKEYVRTGADEIWGEGIYDFQRIGLAVFLHREFSQDFSGEVSLQYHSLIFPNYSDLLAEYQAGSNADSSTGKQNQNVYQAGASVKYGQNTASLGIMLMDYTKQRIITETAQPDGTYYSGDLQKDMLLTFTASREQKLLDDKMLIVPSFIYKYKTSNQNYQDFTTPTSTVPVQFVGDFYNYNEIDATVPFTLFMNRKWEYFASFEWDWKGYTSRPPRDVNDVFVSGLQANSITICGTGFTYKPNEVTRTTFFYQYQSETSNMKFEKYLPYNYEGHTFGINFNYSY